jgi:hypothetical protein
MKLKPLFASLWLFLCGLFLAVYIAAKVHFFTRYDPLAFGGYLREHSVYWAAMAVAAFLIWLIERF